MRVFTVVRSSLLMQRSGENQRVQLSSLSGWWMKRDEETGYTMLEIPTTEALEDLKIYLEDKKLSAVLENLLTLEEEYLPLSKLEEALRKKKSKV
jgi:hypothetical protein